jgi:hypothetical protein
MAQPSFGRGQMTTLGGSGHPSDRSSEGPVCPNGFFSRASFWGAGIFSMPPGGFNAGLGSVASEWLAPNKVRA